MVKSYPKSHINWEGNITKMNTHSIDSKSGQEKAVIVTSTFILDSPTSNDDGKRADCVVLPKYGKGLRRRFTLSYVDGKEVSFCF